jgi:hypothetical protein
LLSTRETADIETPARAATSLRVAMATVYGRLFTR